MTTTTRILPFALLAAALIALPFAASAESGTKGGNSLFVHIDAEGRTLVRGAEVTAVSDSEIRAETSWGDTVLSWIIETDSGTDYVGPRSDSSDRDDIEEGDRVSFSGELDTDVSGLRVIADVIKNWSLAASTESRVTLIGTVEDIDNDDHEFVLSGTRLGDVRVMTDEDTDWKSGDDFGDLETDMRVAVSGSYDEDDDTLDASVVSLEPKLFNRGWNEHMKGWFKAGWGLGFFKGKHGSNE